MSALNITVCIIYNGSAPQLRRTLDSLEAQTVAPQDVQILEADGGWLPGISPVTGDYVLFLYSGSTLSENALEVLSRAATSGKSWY